jgi:hypothetical protein
MDKREQRTQQTEMTGQLLLPGHYDCLTWQLNVTVYPRTKALRWVSVIREPKAGVEIARRFQEGTDWTPAAVQALDDELTGAVLELRRLGDLFN